MSDIAALNVSIGAKNGFRAVIRSHCVANLTYDPATERWRVTSVKLEN